MKLYLDTGNVEDIEAAVKIGVVDGVTTNPTLIAKEGRDFKKTIKEIANILSSHKFDFTVSAEVTNTNSAKEIIEEARELSKLTRHILIKVPLTKPGIEAVSTLSKEGIRCNVTLCFSANQALLAAKAGAWCVSPFVGRIDDEGYEGLNVIREIRKIFDNYNFETKILAASIRSPHDVLECAKIGADIATIPPKIFDKLFYNPLTDLGIVQFEKDWDEYKKNLKGK
ncbi:MAG: fructose-6-phosphate aldolase [Candidatus Woesearchaeota archaeon]|nr:fructose-6-phosphate aldolase [Candidatus Woesearchaeota archaeon]